MGVGQCILIPYVKDVDACACVPIPWPLFGLGLFLLTHIGKGAPICCSAEHTQKSGREEDLCACMDPNISEEKQVGFALGFKNQICSVLIKERGRGKHQRGGAALLACVVRLIITCKVFPLFLV